MSISILLHDRYEHKAYNCIQPTERVTIYSMKDPKRLYKDNKNGKIFGVCSGLADYFGVDVTLIRLVALVLIFMSAGTAILAYFAAALVMPEKPEN